MDGLEVIGFGSQADVPDGFFRRSELRRKRSMIHQAERRQKTQSPQRCFKKRNTDSGRHDVEPSHSIQGSFQQFAEQF